MGRMKEGQPRIVEVKNTTGAALYDKLGNPILLNLEPKTLGGKTPVIGNASLPIIDMTTAGKEDKQKVAANINIDKTTTAKKQDTKPSVEPKKGLSKKEKIGGIIGAGVIIAALAIGGAYYFPRPEGNQNVPVVNTPRTSEAAGTPTPTGKATETPKPTKTLETVGMFLTGIPVPSSLSEIGIANLNNSFPEGQWVNPVYDPFTADVAHDWRGIGPHYPIAFRNIDSDAAHISTHGNVGEIVLVSNKGGKIMIAFMQENAHQKDGAWGKDQNGNPVKGDWKMQYNIHALAPNQEIWVVDPDTGKQLLWPDGSQVIYRANSLGIAAFEVPVTSGNDVRFGLVFRMPASRTGTQPQEVKIERGPNDHPELKGENPLPKTVIKPAVKEK